MPEVKTLRELGIDMDVEIPQIVRGEEWFRSLPEAQQLQRMGLGMFEAWKAGRVDFRDLSRPYPDPVYGEMLREASLKDLLGDQAKAFYRRR